MKIHSFLKRIVKRDTKVGDGHKVWNCGPTQGFIHYLSPMMQFFFYSFSSFLSFFFSFFFFYFFSIANISLFIIFFLYFRVLSLFYFGHYVCFISRTFLDIYRTFQNLNKLATIRFSYFF